MNSPAFAVAAFVVVFGRALGGLYLQRHVPSDHRGEESKDIVKLCLGVVGTLAAVRVIRIERLLAAYGPEAAEARRILRRHYQAVVEALGARERSQLEQLRRPATRSAIDDTHAAIRALAPRTGAQRELRAQALGFAARANENRWLLELQQHDTFSAPLVVVVSWLTAIFTGFGRYATRNATVIAVLFVGALSVSGALFLILEMDDPFAGIVRISDAPVRRALDSMGPE